MNGLSVAQVSVNVRTETPMAPSITTCATNRYIIITNGTAVLLNLTGEVVATDDCGNLVITQSPLAGTVIGPGPTVVTLTATDTDGLTAICMATVSVYNVSPNVTNASYGPGGFMGSFATAPGITYIVEYTDQLVEPTSVWTTLSTVVGDGTVKTFTAAGSLPAYRYYRVRTQ